MRMDNLINQYSSRVGQVSAQTDKISSGYSRPLTSEPFAQILEKQINSTNQLTFTKHAQLRMSERDMTLTEEHIEKLNEAVKKAGQKGVKDTLILMDKMAFIVSVANNTVVTAMKDEDIEGNVFTQIDGAVVV